MKNSNTKNNHMSKLLVNITMFFLGLAIGMGIMFYIFSSPGTNVIEEDVDYSVSAIELFNEYYSNEQEANIKYLDKVLEVKGKVVEKTANIITIGTNEELIVCGFDDDQRLAIEKIDINQIVIVKGKCAGYGLMEVNLVKCSVKK